MKNIYPTVLAVILGIIGVVLGTIAYIQSGSNSFENVTIGDTLVVGTRPLSPRFKALQVSQFTEIIRGIVTTDTLVTRNLVCTGTLCPQSIPGPQGPQGPQGSPGNGTQGPLGPSGPSGALGGSESNLTSINVTGLFGEPAPYTVTPANAIQNGSTLMQSTGKWVESFIYLEDGLTPGSESITFNDLEGSTRIEIGTCPSLKKLSFPKLSTSGTVIIRSNPMLSEINLPNYLYGTITTSSNNNVTEINLPRFTTGNMALSNMGNLLSINTPLYKTSTGITLSNLPVLTNATFPIENSVTGQFSFLDCPKLHTVNFPFLKIAAVIPFSSNTPVTRIVAPLLHTIISLGIITLTVAPMDLPSLVRLECAQLSSSYPNFTGTPNLRSVTGQMRFTSPEFTSLSLPRLEKHEGDLGYVSITGSKFTSFNLDALTFGGITTTTSTLVKIARFPSLVTAFQIEFISSFLDEFYAPLLENIIVGITISLSVFNPGLDLPRLKTGFIAVGTQASSSALYNINLPEYTTGDFRFQGSSIGTLNLPKFSSGSFAMTISTLTLKTIYLPLVSTLTQFNIAFGVRNISLPMLTTCTSSMQIPTSVVFLSLPSYTSGPFLCTSCNIKDLMLPSFETAMAVDLVFSNIRSFKASRLKSATSIRITGSSLIYIDLSSLDSVGAFTASITQINSLYMLRLTRSGTISITSNGTFNAPLLRTLDGSLSLGGTIPSVNLPSLKAITASSVTISGSFTTFNVPVLETVQSMIITAPLANASFPSLVNGTSLTFGNQPNIHLPSLQFISNNIIVTASTTSINLESLETVGGLFEISTDSVTLPSLLSVLGGLVTKSIFNVPGLTIIGQTWTVTSGQTSINAPSLLRLGGLVIPSSVTSMNLPLLTYIEGGISSDQLNIPSFTLMSLERIDGAIDIQSDIRVEYNFTKLIQSSGIRITGNTLPCTAVFPQLTTVSGGMFINECEALNSSVSSLQTVVSSLGLICPNCVTFDLSQLISVGNELLLQGSGLATINLSSLQYVGQDVFIRGCTGNVIAAYVLARLVSIPSFGAGQRVEITCSPQTCTGQCATDAAILTARGVTVVVPNS